MLEDHANLLALPIDVTPFPQVHLSGFFFVCQCLSVHHDTSGVDGLKVVDATQKRRLAGT